jgi:hypothetical protein
MVPDVEEFDHILVVAAEAQKGSQFEERTIGQRPEPVVGNS